MHQTKTEEIYDMIRESILNGEFTSQSVLSEQSIAALYNVSKTPAREALTLLYQEGYLVKKPRKGFSVREMSLSETIQLIQYRTVLEVAVVKIVIAACSDDEIKTLYEEFEENMIDYLKFNRYNSRFHIRLAALTQNKYIEDAVSHALLLSSRKVAKGWFRSIEVDIHRDHRLIVEALLARDVTLAVKLIADDVKQADVDAFNNVFL